MIQKCSTQVKQDESAVRPIADTELSGAVVLECSLGDLENTVEELRAELAVLGRIAHVMIETVKAYSDLFIELTDKTANRQFLAKWITRLERDEARLGLPIWFWRPETGLELKRQLYRRACFLLHEKKAQPDDAWELLREYVTDYAKAEVTDEQLKGVILFADKNPGGAR
jgi:hypothetical protein